jgi:hypothetical protein
MSETQFSIIMDSTAVEATFTRTAVQFPDYVNLWLVQASILTKEEMSARVNQGVGAAYGSGIKNNIDFTIDPAATSSFVGPNKSVPYAQFLETGTRPHKVSTNPEGSLAQWCELKGLNLYAVARSIELNGTKAHPFVRPTYDAVTGPVSRLFERGVAIYLDQMGGMAL